MRALKCRVRKRQRKAQLTIDIEKRRIIGPSRAMSPGALQIVACRFDLAQEDHPSQTPLARNVSKKSLVVSLALMSFCENISPRGLNAYPPLSNICAAERNIAGYDKISRFAPTHDLVICDIKT